MTGKNIVNRARKLKNYVYWYGGKREKCSKGLLDRLSRLYPNIYTQTYINKCNIDIKYGRTCVDCSGLVCYAYNIGDIGSYQIRNTFRVYNGFPKNGMILWREGHVGIFYDGNVIQASGIDEDYSETEKYLPYEWENVLYDRNVDYDSENFHIYPASLYDRSKSGVYVLKKTSNLRTGPGIKYKKIRKINEGCKVRCYGFYSMNDKSGSSWLYAKIGTNCGYVCEKNLRKGN